MKTTQICFHYSPSAHEMQMVSDAFARASADDLGEQEATRPTLGPDSGLSRALRPRSEDRHSFVNGQERDRPFRCPPRPT
jgi:hypothetical protein